MLQLPRKACLIYSLISQSRLVFSALLLGQDNESIIILIIWWRPKGLSTSLQILILKDTHDEQCVPLCVNRLSQIADKITITVLKIDIFRSLIALSIEKLNSFHFFHHLLNLNSCWPWVKCLNSYGC